MFLLKMSLLHHSRFEKYVCRTISLMFGETSVVLKNGTSIKITPFLLRFFAEGEGDGIAGKMQHGCRKFLCFCQKDSQLLYKS